MKLKIDLACDAECAEKLAIMVIGCTTLANREAGAGLRFGESSRARGSSAELIGHRVRARGRGSGCGNVSYWVRSVKAAEVMLDGR
jgi:hypothetical protein